MKYLQHHHSFAFTTARRAKSDLLFALVILCSSAIILTLCKYYEKARYVLFTLALFELMLFATVMKRGFPLAITYNQPLKNFLQNHRDDERFLKIPANNWAMLLPTQLSGGDINGYEPFRLRRYEDAMDFSQKAPIGSVKDIVQGSYYTPLYRILRCKYVFKVKSDKSGNLHDKITEKPGALAHLSLLNQWQIVPREKPMLKILNTSSFDPQKKVLLESAPQFSHSKIIPGVQAKVKLLGSSSQWLDIQATTTRNSILLVTDAYAKGWKVVPYADSSQRQYKVMPADYIVRGIPLSPGFHHFRLEYAPNAFYRGKKISIAALIAYLLAWCALLGITLTKKKAGVIPFENDTDDSDGV